MRSRSLSIVFCVLFLVPSQVISADASQEISFRIEQNKMVVQGSIGDRHRLNLVIDTGATTTVIDKRLAEKLGFEKDKKESALVYGQRVPVRKGFLPELSIGSMTFREIPVLVTDLNMGLQFRVDALIGMEILKRQPFSIDYSSRKIRFGPVLHSDFSLRVNSRVPLVFIFLTVDGSRPLRLMLDTGAEDLILYRQKVEGEVRVTPSSARKNFWAAGCRPVKMRGVFLSKIEMKDTVWENLPAFLLDAPQTAEGYSDGIIGPSALGLETLNFDFQQGIISWTL